MRRPLQPGPLLSALVAAGLFVAAGCRKPQGEVARAEVDAPRPEADADAGADALQADAPQPHGADSIAAAAAPGVIVTEPLVQRYMQYRRLVVERGRAAVDAYRAANPRKRGREPTAAAVQAARAAEEFAVTMRAIEESARAEVGLTREQVAAVGQAAGEVLSARQLWRMSGGDDALRSARAELAAVPASKRRAAERALARNEQGFIEMREARSARTRFGDPAVEAILAHEDALWKVQQEGARVMAEVY